MAKENKSSLIMYQSEDGKTRIEVRFQNETVWLSQRLIAELFQKDIRTINEHIHNVYEEQELLKSSTIRKFRIVQKEGIRNIVRDVEYYNLDIIIAVGYRVKSHRGTQFRQWATERLREYILKGFTIDDDRLKNVSNIGSDYFDELLERIRDIRASEKRFYQKIRDIYKLAVDYDPHAEETMKFFSIVQIKLHYAISGKTAAEIISERVDSTKTNMGLTSWKGIKVRANDVTVAKNYLNHEEIEDLNRIVNMYLDYAEGQAKRNKQIFMRDWQEKLDALLKFNEREILSNPGNISKDIADELALEGYEKYNLKRLKDAANEETIIDDIRLKQIEKSLLKVKKSKRKE